MFFGLAIELSCFTILKRCILEILVSIVTVINVDKPVVWRGVGIDRALLAVIRPKTQRLLPVAASGLPSHIITGDRSIFKHPNINNQLI